MLTFLQGTTFDEPIEPRTVAFANTPREIPPTLYPYKHPPPKRSLQQFSITSYNTLYKSWCNADDFDYVNDKYRTWEYRLPRLRATLTNLNSDIFCLQEIDKNDFHKDFGEFFESKEEGGGYSYNVNRHRKNRLGMSNAILWKNSKFEYGNILSNALEVSLFHSA